MAYRFILVICFFISNAFAAQSLAVFLGANLAISVLNNHNIEVSRNGVATFVSSNAEYRADKLTVEKNGTAQFVAGDYWIDELRLGINTTFRMLNSTLLLKLRNSEYD